MLAVGALAASSSPALAHGNVTCGGGPQEGWASMEQLKKQVWMEGWKLEKAKPHRDCYEVYARTEDGAKLEAFFHPVTLKKLLVLRRGKEIFRAPGFKG